MDTASSSNSNSNNTNQNTRTSTLTYACWACEFVCVRVCVWNFMASMRQTYRYTQMSSRNNVAKRTHIGWRERFVLARCVLCCSCLFLDLGFFVSFVSTVVIVVVVVVHEANTHLTMNTCTPAHTLARMICNISVRCVAAFRACVCVCVCLCPCMSVCGFRFNNIVAHPLLVHGCRAPRYTKTTTIRFYGFHEMSHYFQTAIKTYDTCLRDRRNDTTRQTEWKLENGWISECALCTFKWCNIFIIFMFQWIQINFMSFVSFIWNFKRIE